MNNLGAFMVFESWTALDMVIRLGLVDKLNKGLIASYIVLKTLPAFITFFIIKEYYKKDTFWNRLRLIYASILMAFKSCLMIIIAQIFKISDENSMN